MRVNTGMDADHADVRSVVGEGKRHADVASRPKSSAHFQRGGRCAGVAHVAMGVKRSRDIAGHGGEARRGSVR